MAADYSLPRQEVSYIVDELMKELTPNGVLQPRAEMVYEINLVAVNAKFEVKQDESGKEARRFKLVIFMNDQSQYATVALEGYHDLVDGTPKVRETKYTALVPGDMMVPIELNDVPLFRDDINLRLIPSTNLKYKKALTRAMQIMVGLEKELAQEFES